MTMAFILAFAVSYFIQTAQAYEDADKLIKLKIDDVIMQIGVNDDNLREIRRESDANALAKARSFAEMIRINPALVGDFNQLEKIRGLLEVDELHIINDEGILFSGTVKDYYGYDMASDKQSAAFLPAITDKDFELAQDPQPKGINKEVFQYAGVARKDADGIVQIGYRPEKLAQAIEVVDIKNLAPGFRIGSSGSILVAKKSGEIVSTPEERYLGKSLFEYGFEKHDFVKTSRTFLKKLSDNKVLVGYKSFGDYLIIGQLPEEEMYAGRNSSIFMLVGFNLMLFALIFYLVSKLVQMGVIDGIYKVNRSLAKITQGDLEERIEVYTNEEFRALSGGINATVDALKGAIKEVAARIDDELAFAKAIQLSALPSRFPAFPEKTEFDIFATMRPAKEVGGDFFDFFLIGEDKLAFLIADVSGKGIPGALFMMISKTIIKHMTLTNDNVAQALEKANNLLCENNEAGMFVTVFLGVLDLKSGKVSFANAGHNPPLIKRSGGDYEWLPVNKSFVLAVMEDVVFSEQEIILSEGDILFMYTDGVTEANNKEFALFSNDRLLCDLNRNTACRSGNPVDVIGCIQDSVDAFACGAAQSDDITMLCVKYFGSGSMSSEIVS